MAQVKDVQVTVHSTGSGTDSLTGKEDSDGLTVTFADGTVVQQFLSWKSFRQLLGLKAGKAVKPVVPVAAPAGNGATVAK